MLEGGEYIRRGRHRVLFYENTHLGSPIVYVVIH